MIDRHFIIDDPKGSFHYETTSRNLAEMYRAIGFTVREVRR